MAIYDTTNETHDKYVQALKSLDYHNMTSEYTKVPDTKEEIAFMKETNKVRYSNTFAIDISQERFNDIFMKPCVSDELPSVHTINAIIDDMFGVNE